jgi:hypothetical protein
LKLRPPFGAAAAAAGNPHQGIRGKPLQNRPRDFAELQACLLDELDDPLLAQALRFQIARIVFAAHHLQLQLVRSRLLLDPQVPDSKVSQWPLPTLVACPRAALESL